MAVTIKLRRGLEANLPALAVGEVAFTTDNQDLWIGTSGGNFNLTKVSIGTIVARPATPEPSTFYIATNENNKLYVYDGSIWRAAGITDLADMAGTLDDIADGIIYGRVANTELTNNKVSQLDNGGTPVTAAAIASHLSNLVKHREINDAASGSTDLWSATKIQAAIDASAINNDFLPDVMGVQVDATLDPTATPTIGDRYIITNSAALHSNFGVITGVGDNDVVQYDGSAFVISYDASTTVAGALTWDQASTTYQKYDGIAWSEHGGLSGVTAGAGIDKTGNTVFITDENKGVQVNATGLQTAGAEIAAVAGGLKVDPVNAHQLRVEPADFAGSGLEDDGADNLRIAAQGNGLTGGAGTILAVGAGNGISVTANDVSVKSDVTSGPTVANLSVSINGAGVAVDNVTIKHSLGEIYVNEVDGGTF